MEKYKCTDGEHYHMCIILGKNQVCSQRGGSGEDTVLPKTENMSFLMLCFKPHV